MSWFKKKPKETAPPVSEVSMCFICGRIWANEKAVPDHTCMRSRPPPPNYTFIAKPDMPDLEPDFELEDDDE